MNAKLKKDFSIHQKKAGNLLELIEQVSDRPGMYVGISRFDLAAAYIDGYFHALMNFQPESGDAYELRKFAYWLALKFKQPRNWHWSGILKAVYSDDEILFEELPSLFKEFLNNKDKIDSDPDL